MEIQKLKNKKIIKAVCLGGLIPPLLAIRHNPETELYTVDILRGSDGWWHVSTHVSLKEAHKSFGEQLDKAIEAG